MTQIMRSVGEDYEPDECRYCGVPLGVGHIDHTGWMPECRNAACPSRNVEQYSDECPRCGKVVLGQDDGPDRTPYYSCTGCGHMWGCEEIGDPRGH